MTSGPLVAVVPTCGGAAALPKPTTAVGTPWVAARVLPTSLRWRLAGSSAGRGTSTANDWNRREPHRRRRVHDHHHIAALLARRGADFVDEGGEVDAHATGRLDDDVLQQRRDHFCDTDSPCDEVRGRPRTPCRRRRRRERALWVGVHRAMQIADCPYYGRPHRRIGEAMNPGPATADAASATSAARSILGYRMPGGDGFKGARRADAGAEGLSGFVDGMPENQSFALAIETANSTGWQPLQKYLMRTRAHVILAQEHHLRGEQVAAASQWAKGEGWKSLWVEVGPGEGAGTRGGVAIFARDYLGMARPPWGDEMVVPGRVAAAVVEAPGHRQILMFSAYLRDGEGMSVANRAIMAAIGACVQRMGHGSGDFEARAGAMPYLVGADFNSEPEDLVGTGMLDTIDAQIFAPATRRGTCRTATAGRTLDFFMLDAGLSRAVGEVATVEDGTLATHVPVRLVFHPRVTCLKALSLRSPPALPTERLYGPLPAPPHWRQAAALCEEAMAVVSKGTSMAAAQAAIDDAYAIWAKTADEELQRVTGKYYDGASLRGETPRLIWKSIVPERVKERDQGEAEPWRYADALAREIARTFGSCDGDYDGTYDQLWDELHDKSRGATRT